MLEYLIVYLIIIQIFEMITDDFQEISLFIGTKSLCNIFNSRKIMKNEMRKLVFHLLIISINNNLKVLTKEVGDLILLLPQPTREGVEAQYEKRTDPQPDEDH